MGFSTLCFNVGGSGMSREKVQPAPQDQKGLRLDEVMGALSSGFFLWLVVSLIFMVAFRWDLTIRGAVFALMLLYLSTITYGMRKRILELPSFKTRLLVEWGVAVFVGVTICILVITTFL